MLTGSGADEQGASGAGGPQGARAMSRPAAMIGATEVAEPVGATPLPFCAVGSGEHDALADPPSAAEDTAPFQNAATNSPAGPLAASVLACALFASCAATPTAAFIARFDGAPGELRRFRTCRVHLRWSEARLTKRCGDPIALVPSAYEPAERCILYSSVAHALGTRDHVAPYYIICLRTDVRAVSGKSGAAFSPDGKWRIASVTGVSAVPSTLLPVDAGATLGPKER